METWSKIKEAVGSSGGDSPRYQLVGASSVFTTLKDKSSKTRNIILGAGTAAFLLFLYLLGHSLSGSSGHAVISTDRLPPSFLHLLSSAPKADSNLCKNIVSSGALGYTNPSILGWEEPAKGHEEGHKYSASDRVAHVQKYLKKRADQDVVLIVDGYNTWFQLRPQTLLSRYFDINSKADERIVKQLGSDSYHIHQEIVFAAQRTCDPWTKEEAACYAAPESILPTSTYGSDTDKTPQTTRPRYLNSDFIIGSAKALRALYAQVAHRMQQNGDNQDIHRIMGQIYGDQEIHRELLHQSSRSWLGRAFSSSSSAKSSAYKPADIASVQTRNVTSLEFGIGLDYESKLAYVASSPSETTTTKYGGEDGTLSWIPLNDASRIYTANEHLSISQSSSPLKIDTPSPDIATTVPPFWTFSEENPLPRSAKWSEVPLLTDVVTGISPVTLILPRGGSDDLRRKWWDRMWFQKHARTLFTAQIYAPMGVVAVTSGTYPVTALSPPNSTETTVSVVDDFDATMPVSAAVPLPAQPQAAWESGVKQWWNPEDWKGGARTVIERRWLRYDDICDGTEDEVFRDGKGRWLLPKNH
ncbi:hypothetical protein AAFC00_002289 [Neodothiora populina]|uniref:Uncharacterized protein n=1 Tax=Neodothiora populina TaxID=2781224 RepID=A0ABR3PGY4_9PEZI